MGMLQSDTTTQPAWGLTTAPNNTGNGRVQLRAWGLLGMPGSQATLTLMDCVSNVDGSMLGKSFTATGSRNSIKGTTTKTRKGTRRNRSAQMRRN